MWFVHPPAGAGSGGSAGRFGRLALALVLGAAACSGSIRSPEGTSSPGAGGSGAGGGSGSAGGGGGAGGSSNEPPATPADPSELETLCSKDTPHPRRVLRLTNKEIITALRGLTTIDDAAIPAGFTVPTLGAKVEDGLSVSRAFHESVDELVTKLADQVAGGGKQLGELSCAMADFGKNEACTKAFLTGATGKLFRGMGTADDVTTLLTLVKDIAARSDGKTAMRYAVRAMGLNPRALYLLEGLDLPGSTAPSGPGLMSAAEVASFLSYRITGKPPTDGVSNAVKQAMQKTPTVESVRQLIRAQFDGPALEAGATTFFDALLGVDDIAGLSRDAKKHPTVDAAFMAALQKETHEAIQSRIKSTTTFAQALTDEAPFSSVGDSASGDYGKVGRPGLFTLPGVIASASTVDHTDIPRRGRFMLRQLFCDVVPSPPANLVTMIPPLPANASERQRFEKVEMEVNCKGCHVRVNRLGFALENYDEMGRIRTTDEKGNAINPASTHQVTGAGAISFSDPRDLFKQAAAHPVAQNCLAIQAFRFFARRLERGEGGAEDACLLRDLAAEGRKGNFTLVDLFTDAMARIVVAPRG